MNKQKGNPGNLNEGLSGRLIRRALLNDARLSVSALGERDGQVLVTGSNNGAVVIVDFGQCGSPSPESINDSPSRGVKRLSLTQDLLGGVGEEELLLRVYRILGVPLLSAWSLKMNRSKGRVA